MEGEFLDAMNDGDVMSMFTSTPNIVTHPSASVCLVIGRYSGPDSRY
jgi:hypothetical protein